MIRWLAPLFLASATLQALAQPLAEPLWREDLAQFREQFLDRDRAFSVEARAQATQQLAVLHDRTGEVDTIAFGLALARIAALADNGHSTAFASARLNRCNRVEIRLVPFGESFHVLRTRPTEADLLGARLLAIDGVPLTRLRELAHALLGGTPAWRDRQAPSIWESPQLLHAVGLSPVADAAVYRLELTDGRIVERLLVAVPPSPTRARGSTDRLLLPEVLGSELGWRALLPPSRAPWVLRDAGQRLRWRHDAELDAIVLEMRQASDAQGEPLGVYFDAVRAAVVAHKPRHLVLDLRFNGGGDLTRTRDFAEELPRLVPGRLFVLTSPWTFSAAISTAGYLKQAEPSRVTVVGEAVGDRLMFFAEGRTVTLKNSREVLRPATERHDYLGGCRHHADCHAPVVSRPIAVATLTPDIPAPLTFDDYRAGIDPAMVAVAHTLRR